MACSAIQTGSHFLTSALAHLDCQGQAIGAYGYGAMAAQAAGGMAVEALLALFVAIYGLRLMVGAPMGGRDVVGVFLKLGIMLTLATSWPAYRVVVYDVVVNAPTDVARAMSRASGLPGGADRLADRLQNIDDGLVAVTMFGSGRLTGGAPGGRDLGNSFNGIALDDQTGFGWGRVVFLVGVMGPYALTRLGAGLLLALAPVVAGLMLFAGSFSLFMGWVRALVFTMLAGVALHVVCGVEVSIMTPWLSDVMAQRGSGVYTPSVPTELIVLTMAFALAALGLLWVMARLAFHPHFPVSIPAKWIEPHAVPSRPIAELRHDLAPFAPAPPAILPEPAGRARDIADSVSTAMRREERAMMVAASVASQPGAPDPRASGPGEHAGAAAPGFGDTYRRQHRRTSASGQTRDKQS